MSKSPRSTRSTPLPTTKRDQKWIDEALASGPPTPLTKKEMKTIRDRILGNDTKHH